MYERDYENNPWSYGLGLRLNYYRVGLSVLSRRARLPALVVRSFSSATPARPYFNVFMNMFSVVFHSKRINLIFKNVLPHYKAITIYNQKFRILRIYMKTYRDQEIHRFHKLQLVTTEC